MYTRVLALFYLIGFILHAMDVFSLRLSLSEMSMIWKVWIIYLMLFDFLAVVGLWLGRIWGIAIFLLIATSQLVAYIGFKNVFGSQIELVTFHIVTLTIFFSIVLIGKIRHSENQSFK